jgi:hypothetical protein
MQSGFRVARTLEDPAGFWRKANGGHFAPWDSIWDSEVIPRMQSVTSLSLAKSEITDVRKVIDFSANYLGADRLVRFALTRTGFGIEDGIGVSYPDGDADTDYIPAGCVVVSDYRAEKFIVAETDYLEAIAETFKQNSLTEAAREIEAFLVLLPSLPLRPRLPIAELYKALMGFTIDEVVRFSMARQTFQLGQYGPGIGYHAEYSPGAKYPAWYRKRVHIAQFYGPGVDIPEDQYLTGLIEIFRCKGASAAAAKIKSFRTRRRLIESCGNFLAAVLECTVPLRGRAR